MKDGNILLVGSEGNMGKRYQAILKHLNIPYLRVDKNVDEKGPVNSILIATPTDTHQEVLNHYLGYDVPILCEKPITKDLKALGALLDRAKGKLTMVNQYSFLHQDPDLRGPTYYNYFKHGGDGIAWDCIQLLGLAKDEVILKETSPIWQCIINGSQVSIEQMDRAYVMMIEMFSMFPDYSHLSTLTPDQIMSMHEKASRYVPQ